MHLDLRRPIQGFLNSELNRSYPGKRECDERVTDESQADTEPGGNCQDETTNQKKTEVFIVYMQDTGGSALGICSPLSNSHCFRERKMHYPDIQN